MSVSAAKSRVQQAQTLLDARRYDEVEQVVDTGMSFLIGLPSEETAVVAAELTALRLAAAEAARADRAGRLAAAPRAVAPPENEARVLTRARTNLAACRADVDSGRTEGVTGRLTEIAGTLSGFSGEAAAGLRAEIDAIRAAVARTDRVRRITSELDRHFRDAESGEPWPAAGSARTLDRLRERLADEEVRRTLPAGTLRQYQDRLATATANLADVVKADALDRALPLVRELEERLAAEPYAGLNRDEGYAVSTELGDIKERVLRALDQIPADDPDVIAVRARLSAADGQIDAAGAALAMTRLEASVADRWRMTESEFDGWQVESYDGPSRPGDVPDLPKTRLAMMRTGYLLRDPEAQQIRTDHADNPAIQAVYRATDETFEAAAVKLRAAYDRVIDHAAGLPAPAVEADVCRLSHLAAAARTSFAHTPHREPVLARILEVEAHWQAEYTALLRTRQEVYDRLAAEAEAAWPGIVAATGAGDGFNPADPATVGTTVLLSGVYNRSGWDFTGTDFSTRRNGIPVGGSYEPHVLQALEHAWYDLKLDVNDRIAWDVVGVVTGPTQLGQRTHRTLTDQNNREIGKIEEWPLVDAVHLRIIALHAGPVAVGPRPAA